MIRSYEQLISLLDKHIMKCTHLPKQYISMEIEFFCFYKDKTNLNIAELEKIILSSLQMYNCRFSRRKILNIIIENIGIITYEPGGQLEFSSQKESSLNDLLQKSINFLQFLIDRLIENGYTILFTGCNPRKLNQKILRQEERYALMQKEFDEFGVFGSYMMLNTASLQINVDFGCYNEFGKRWRNLNLFYPIFVSVFGNSSVFNESDTGYNSYRQHIIEEIGGNRVYGLYRTNFQEDTKININNYSLFLYENDIFTYKKINNDEEILSELLRDVFPIVRIREYFEVRYFDSLELYFICCPIILVYIINYDIEMKNWIEKHLDELYYLYNNFSVSAIENGLNKPKLRLFCCKFINTAIEILNNRYQNFIDIMFIKRLEEYWQKRIDKYDE